MAMKLTKGAISVISSGNWQATDVKPVLQVLEIRKVRMTEAASAGNEERWWIVLSDGSFYQQGMLATQLNDLVRSQRLQRGSIVRLNWFISPTIEERKIVIILDVDVIHSSCYSTVSIAGLNPYRDRWTIKACVIAKAELRRCYNNAAKGEGKVFSFDLVDHTDGGGGEIRTRCFDDVADQFYDQIEVGKVYFISDGKIKPAQKADDDRNDHEIRLDHKSTIWPCLDVDD